MIEVHNHANLKTIKEKILQNKKKIKEGSLIACTGCNSAATLYPVLPLLNEGVINDDIIRKFLLNKRYISQSMCYKQFMYV